VGSELTEIREYVARYNMNTELLTLSSLICYAINKNNIIVIMMTMTIMKRTLLPSTAW